MLTAKLKLWRRKDLSAASFLETLREVYGERAVMVTPRPIGYGGLDGPVLTCNGCLRFCNLAAEALIRELDLRRGERVFLGVEEWEECFLLALAVIKAGGVAVPLHPSLTLSEVRCLVEESGAVKGLVSPAFLEEAGKAAGLLRGREMMVTGPRGEGPASFHSLDAAMRGCSGFFLPYTLKKTSVVALFLSRDDGGRPLAMMVTNQGVFGSQRRTALLFPLRGGEKAMYALPPARASSFAALAALLCAGAVCVRWHEGTRSAGLQESAVICAAPGFHPGGESTEVFSRKGWGPRFFFLPLPDFRENPAESGACSREPSLSPPEGTPVVETAGADRTGTFLAVRLRTTRGKEERGWTGMVLPGQRFRVEGDGGIDGELAVKGAGVTPGFWNDLEETFARVREGWFHTGLHARKKGPFLTLYPHAR